MASPNPRAAAIGIGVVILVATLVIAGLALAKKFEIKKKEARQKEVVAIRAANPPVVRVIKVGKVPTVLPYGEDGCAEYRVEVWDFYWVLQGRGKVRVQPPHGGAAFTDEPGNNVDTNYKPGLWRWCKLEDGPTGVQLWQ